MGGVTPTSEEIPGPSAQDQAILDEQKRKEKEAETKRIKLLRGRRVFGGGDSDAGTGGSTGTLG